MERSQRGLGEVEFILFMGLVAASTALAIDMLLPAFASMRPTFGLDAESTQLSATISVFFAGMGLGNLVHGPLSDALGRKPVLYATTLLYGLAALAAALAPSLTILLVVRFVWGFASAGPRTMTQAIVRDRYSGDEMARIMALVQTAFLLGPIAAPILGKLILNVGSWRWVLAFGAIVAAGVALWSLRLEETLPPTDRRPLRLGSTLAGFRLVVSNRVTLGYGLAVTFAFAAFFSYLASSELIFESVYGRPNWFVPTFSALSAVMAMAAIGAGRILRVVSADRLNLLAGFGLVGSSALFLTVALVTDGRPPIGWFIVLIGLTMVSNVVLFPTSNSLALEPMGALAGTAAAVLGFLSSVLGAALSQVINQAIDHTITPMAAGYVGYSIVALGFILFARSGR